MSTYCVSTLIFEDHKYSAFLQICERVLRVCFGLTSEIFTRLVTGPLYFFFKFTGINPGLLIETLKIT